MTEVTQKDAVLMETAREVLRELTEKTTDLYRGTDNKKLLALKKSAGDDVSSAELAAIMHMIIFLSDDSVSAKMNAAVDKYMSAGE